MTKPGYHNWNSYSNDHLAVGSQKQLQEIFEDLKHSEAGYDVEENKDSDDSIMKSDYEEEFEPEASDEEKQIIQ